MEPLIEEYIKIPFYREKLEALDKAIQNSKKAFDEAGSFSFCKSCAESGINCCGEGLEWKLSPEEFFINLSLFALKGKAFEIDENNLDNCLFLGKEGCLLELVPLFCRNFFCSNLSKFLGQKRLIFIQETMEEEAHLSFRLCEYLKNNLNLRGGLPWNTT